MPPATIRIKSRPGEGLPKWTAANRGIKNTDIVVWYTLGFHHVVRSEDWPVMPLAWNEFELRAFNFFARNPAVDLPKHLSNFRLKTHHVLVPTSAYASTLAWLTKPRTTAN